VVRGGSWNNKPENLRAANRNRNDADNRNNNIGFRLAQSARAALRPEPGAGLSKDRPGVVRGCP
jgi:hypothetical protein